MRLTLVSEGDSDDPQTYGMQILVEGIGPPGNVIFTFIQPHFNGHLYFHCLDTGDLSETDPCYLIEYCPLGECVSGANGWVIQGAGEEGEFTQLGSTGVPFEDAGILVAATCEPYTLAFDIPAVISQTFGNLSIFLEAFPCPP